MAGISIAILYSYNGFRYMQSRTQHSVCDENAASGPVFVIHEKRFPLLLLPLAVHFRCNVLPPLDM